MSLSQHIMTLVLPQSKAEVVTNAVAGASVAPFILPAWWPSQESISHNLAIVYLVVSIIWVVVQVGFKIRNEMRDDRDD